MKTKNITIAVIVIILLLLLGAGGFLMLNKNTATSNKTATSQTQTATVKNEQTRKSLLDLIKIGQNVRCTFKSEVTNGSTEGTVYV